MSYDMLDRFLRNNLGDDDYAEYLIALDSLCAPPQRKPLTDAWIVDSVKEAGETSAPHTDFECFAWLVRKVEAAHGIKEKNT